MALPMVYGPHNQVQMPYVWASLTAAQDLGLKLLMLIDDDGETAIRDTVVGSQVDGVMLMEVQRHDPRVRLLSSLKCPAVLVGTPDDSSRLPYVDFDAGLAGRLCAEHLLELGHRAVGYLGQSPATFRRDVAYAVRARDGALAALRGQRGSGGAGGSGGVGGQGGAGGPGGAGGQGGARTAWAPCDGQLADVARAVDGLLAKVPGLTGLIVYNERALPLVLDRLAGLGLRVPHDVSVVAVCPDDEAERAPGPGERRLPARGGAGPHRGPAAGRAGQRGVCAVGDDSAADVESSRHHRVRAPVVGGVVAGRACGRCGVRGTQGSRIPGWRRRP